MEPGVLVAGNSYRIKRTMLLRRSIGQSGNVEIEEKGDGFFF